MLKIVFAGTPEFALPSLKAILNYHEVCAVYTKPDRPSGRGLKLAYSPVKQYVLDHYPKIPILQPVNLKDDDTQRQLGEFYADIMVVIAYGLILPKPVLSLFKYGCINVHASLLPRWRGAAPIQRALLAGDSETGVTIMQINEGLDTGDMLMHEVYKIKPEDNAGEVHDHLAELGAKALIETLNQIKEGISKPLPQDDSLATYAAKITKDEAMINWQNSPSHILHQIRAFNPWPVAFTYLGGELLKVWDAEVVSLKPTSHLAGKVISANEQGIDVATQQGIIRLLKVQIPGGKAMSVQSFLNARKNLIIPEKTLLGEKKC